MVPEDLRTEREIKEETARRKFSGGWSWTMPLV
jgi:nitric oxide synthase oxygenase domain/subunit